MKLLAVALVCLPTLAFAQTPALERDGATPHGRVLTCYGEAFALVELVDVATKSLHLVAGETVKGSTPERQNVVAGMLASGTINDQQQALDVAERLDLCVAGAVERAAPDAAAAFAAGILRAELAVAITMADGFTSDFGQSAAAMNQFLASGDPARQAATNGAFSKFGPTVRGVLDRVRIAVDDLVAKSTVR